MPLGLEVDAARSVSGRLPLPARPMMLLAAPTLPGRGLSPACATYGSSVLILPDALLGASTLASLCTQGEINEALRATRSRQWEPTPRCGPCDECLGPGLRNGAPGGVGPADLPTTPDTTGALLRDGDVNVVDAYRYWTRVIIADIDMAPSPLHVAIENF